MGPALPLVTLFGAVAAAVWVGGFGPAVLVSILGYAACNYLFIEPRFSFHVDDPGNLIGLIPYLVTCSLIIAFGEAVRRAEQRANEQRELLRITLHSIGDAVITTDVDGRVTSMNAVAEWLTGWTKSDGVGRPLDAVFRIVNEDTRHPVENPARRALRDGVAVGLVNHTLLIRKDGGECPIDDSAAPIRDESGTASGCVLIFRDVTAQRRVERAQASQLLTTSLLASIIESSDDAIISKSLDGVIQSWNAGAERLFGYTAGEAVGRHISIVIPPDRLAEEDDIIASLKAGRRIEHVETERLRSDGSRIFVSLTISPIKDEAGTVVGASKITRGKIELRTGRIELAPIIQQAVEAIRALYRSLDHELTITLPPRPVHLEADPARLAQVVGNLLSNAGKFTDRGGHVWLTAEEDGVQAVIRVRDNGIGIAAEHHPRLFEMFAQLDTSLERSRDGLGIGLTLVKTLVELHGGTVDVRSDGPGRGSEFTVRLPILIDTAREMAPPAVVHPVGAAPRRVLIVDDSQDGAESLAMLLEFGGHTTYQAHDGVAALEAANRLRPDAVLLDIGLPGLNGYEVCSRIRKEPWGRQILLVALTGWGQDEDRHRSREAGFDAHMVKPVDFDVLLKLLASRPSTLDAESPTARH